MICDTSGQMLYLWVKLSSPQQTPAPKCVNWAAGWGHLWRDRTGQTVMASLERSMEEPVASAPLQMCGAQCWTRRHDPYRGRRGEGTGCAWIRRKCRSILFANRWTPEVGQATRFPTIASELG